MRNEECKIKKNIISHSSLKIKTQKGSIAKFFFQKNCNFLMILF